MNQLDKSHFLDRVSREMDEDLGALELSSRDALAACCRILAHEGHESGLASQVTAVGEKPGSWWTLKFGLGFEEVKPGLAEEARAFLLQPSIVRGTFAYWARRSAV